MVYNEKTVSKELVFEGKIIKVTSEKAELENGQIVTRELVTHNGGVCVVAVDDQQNTYLVRQFRYPFKEVLTEVPAGKREKDENPLECGTRELQEEIGATAENFVSLGKLYPTVAYDTEVIYMYLATGLSFSKQHLDEDEYIDVVKIPLKEAVEMVMRDELPDSKTQLAILKAYNYLQNN